MIKYTKDALRLILENHEKWLKNNEEGFRATLDCADLRGVNFNHVNLSGANFMQANLCGADFSGAKLEGALFTEICPSGTAITILASPSFIRNTHACSSGR